MRKSVFDRIVVFGFASTRSFDYEVRDYGSLRMIYRSPAGKNDFKLLCPYCSTMDPKEVK